MNTPAVKIAVCYDGIWYQNAARYLAHVYGGPVTVAGLHDAIRWHAATVFGCPAQQAVITHACYVAGRDPDAPATPWDQELADRHVIRRDVPVTVTKGEVGADVELALTCYQIACETSPDLIALLTGDGDLAPLAARLAGRGIRVLVPRANVSYPHGDTAIAVTTSAWLTRAATDTPTLTDLIEPTRTLGYPCHLTRPYPAASTSPDQLDGFRRHGVVTGWGADADYGFITSADGSTWFVSSRHTAGNAMLQPGTLVTFTGHPAPPPGKSYPRAYVVLPLPPALTEDDRPEAAADSPNTPGRDEPHSWQGTSCHR